MTITTDDPTDLLAVRELADDILSSGTEPMLDVQSVGLESVSYTHLTLPTTPYV